MSSLSVGIVGLPNVGKSTLFNALLQKQAALAANYPFATIEPNVGIVPVPDTRLPVLARIANTTKVVPATVEFYDIAGLVAGASQGAGLGNKFLAHIRETSCIVHVVRVFKNENIIKEGSVDPLSDYQTISTELQLSDLTTLQKQSEPKGTQATPEAKLQWSLIQNWKSILNEGRSLREVIQSEEELITARGFGLLTAKPEMVALNVSEEELAQAPAIRREYSEVLQIPEERMVVFCAQMEADIAGLEESERQEYLQSVGVAEPGLERLIRQAYITLGLQSFYTAGEVEARAWTIKQGTFAPDAAGVIHTDFVKHFIRANVVSYQDFVECNGWKGAKEKGKLRQEGRDYVMQADDVVEFLIGK